VLDSLQKLGKQQDFFDSLIKDPTRGRKKKEDGKEKEQYLIRVVFDLDEKKVIADPIKYQRELAKEYLWVGHTFRASRETKARLTTNNLRKYLMVESTDSGKADKTEWRFVEDNLISNVLTSVQKLRQEGRSTNKLDELGEILSELKKTFIEGGGTMVFENFEKHLERQVVLYTVCVRKSSKFIELARHEGYRDFLRLVIGMPSDVREGTCHVCGSTTQVLSDPAFPSGSLLKVWTKDKKGFIAGISDSDEARISSFAICVKCRDEILSGWGYVKKKLNLPIANAGFNAYLIPAVQGEFTKDILDKLSSEVKKAFDAVVSYDGLLDFEKALKDISEMIFKESWYSVSVIFGKPESAHFKLLSLVQDVPITDLHKLRERVNKISNNACTFFGEDRRLWYLGFSEIYRLLPLRKGGRGSELDWQPLVELFSSMLSFSPYPRSRLIKYAVLLAKVYRFQLFNLYGNIHKPKKHDLDAELCRALLKFNYFLTMLKNMGVVDNVESEVGEVVPAVECEQDERLRKIGEWFKEMDYSGLQRGLFLLGYLVGEVGRAQYRKGDTKKSVLDKIDFNGMKTEKVITLSNQILKLLRDYRILDESNERVYYCAVKLLNKHRDWLRVNPVENAFYLLSGYAFNTYIHLSRGGLHG
jgi:CRISPR-associated protein Csh1